jgi:hypothetical protein
VEFICVILKMQIALINLERHRFTNMTDVNFMIRYEILFSENENWHFMYNFLNDSVICENFEYDLKTPYGIVRFISSVPKLVLV